MTYSSALQEGREKADRIVSARSQRQEAVRVASTAASIAKADLAKGTLLAIGCGLTIWIVLRSGIIPLNRTSIEIAILPIVIYICFLADHYCSYRQPTYTTPTVEQDWL